MEDTERQDTYVDSTTTFPRPPRAPCPYPPKLGPSIHLYLAVRWDSGPSCRASIAQAQQAGVTAAVQATAQAQARAVEQALAKVHAQERAARSEARAVERSLNLALAQAQAQAARAQAQGFAHYGGATRLIVSVGQPDEGILLMNKLIREYSIISPHHQTAPFLPGHFQH
ncbi:hypothetical protein IAR50_005644 [Cryptococcus sp. DSM 104548]